MSNRLRALAFAAVVLLSPAARASELDDGPIVPPAGPDHGKMATEEATPVGAGAVEVETAYSPKFANRGSGGFDRSADGHTHASSLAFFYGVNEHLDVKVGSGFANTVDRSDPTGPARGAGATDLVLGTRWRFLADVERALDLTLATTVVAPTGLEEAEDALGLTQGYWSLRNALVASKDWGRKTANAELAVTVPMGGGAGDLVGGASANVAFGYAVVPWFQPIAEVNYEAARDVTTQQRLALTAGLNMTARSGTRLLVGVQQAVWGRDVGQDTTALAAFKVAF
ncbi:hypothetical protein [Anaeromyxobacter sp. Fw109-5]|uniref:hypothetical protein n=1 Tax=Anaeromyxobacter sp. (strain Fw109-5) TaxID=404589 RepID=UPI0000ED6DF1|nr:hypothetical protein [Anaeromyxobacter sp. Fw109-5]ABS28280.1 conserved hypothetical protein [Anaeromyxobacter sp. Fw109-5]